MNFTTSPAPAPGADIDILLADATALVNSATAFENGVSAFPATIGLGTFAAVQKIASASGSVVVAANAFVRHVVVVYMIHHQNLQAPLSEADGLRLVAALGPAAQLHTRAVQGLQARRDAIAALPSLGPISAVNAILQALGLVKKVADTARAALITYALTGAASDAWIALADNAIAQLDNTISLFSAV
ncbi:hypothetical protein DXG01_010401 [Tephrocybe rancida]|nr:hypothetical protein DXG01_010401 [Tephrocybe rancida]